MSAPVPDSDSWVFIPAMLVAFMKVHGLTDKDVAALVKVNERTVRKWRMGEREMTYASWVCLMVRHR